MQKRSHRQRSDYLPKSVTLVVYRDENPIEREIVNARNLVAGTDEVLNKLVNDIDADRSIELQKIRPAVELLTESALIHDIEQTTEMLFELRRLGFHLSIDDFGTGYSSLAYLRRFPIDELKIDRMFVQGMAHSIQDRQIVQSIIDLAHNFGLSVVAEGVELPETLPELLALGCDQVQGYIYAKPMAADALLAWRREFSLSSQSVSQ